MTHLKFQNLSSRANAAVRRAVGAAMLLAVSASTAACFKGGDNPSAGGMPEPTPAKAHPEAPRRLPLKVVPPNKGNGRAPQRAVQLGLLSGGEVTLGPDNSLVRFSDLEDPALVAQVKIERVSEGFPPPPSSLPSTVELQVYAFTPHGAQFNNPVQIEVPVGSVPVEPAPVLITADPSGAWERVPWPQRLYASSVGRLSMRRTTFRFLRRGLVSKTILLDSVTPLTPCRESIAPKLRRKTVKTVNLAIAPVSAVTGFASKTVRDLGCVVKKPARVLVSHVASKAA